MNLLTAREIQRRFSEQNIVASSDEKASLAAECNYFYKRQQPSIAEFSTDEAAQLLWKNSKGLVRAFVT